MYRTVINIDCRSPEILNNGTSVQIDVLDVCMSVKHIIIPYDAVFKGFGHLATPPRVALLKIGDPTENLLPTLYPSDPGLVTLLKNYDKRHSVGLMGLFHSCSRLFHGGLF